MAHLIAREKSAIASRWFAAAVETYPPDTSRFLKTRKDPFANPVGSTTLKALEELLDQLPAAADTDRLAACLEPVIRIRAVQGLRPARALAFIPQLKAIVRRRLDAELAGAGLQAELRQLEERIDQLCLVAFDLYLACREKVFQLKANETRNRVFRAFERAGLVAPEPGPDAVEP